jgi:hypothetical protein
VAREGVIAFYDGTERVVLKHRLPLQIPELNILVNIIALVTYNGKTEAPIAPGDC